MEAPWLDGNWRPISCPLSEKHTCNIFNSAEYITKVRHKKWCFDRNAPGFHFRAGHLKLSKKILPLKAPPHCHPVSRVSLRLTCLHPSGVLLGMPSQRAWLSWALLALTPADSTTASAADPPVLHRERKDTFKAYLYDWLQAQCRQRWLKIKKSKQIRKALKHSDLTKENKHISILKHLMVLIKNFPPLQSFSLLIYKKLVIRM